MTDRTGQVVQICYQPLILATITGWDAALSHWESTITTPPLGTNLPLYEAFLQYLDDHPEGNLP